MFGKVERNNHGEYDDKNGCIEESSLKALITAHCWGQCRSGMCIYGCDSTALGYIWRRQQEEAL